MSIPRSAMLNLLHLSSLYSFIIGSTSNPVHLCLKQVFYVIKEDYLEYFDFYFDPYPLFHSMVVCFQVGVVRRLGSGSGSMFIEGFDPD